MCLTLFQHKKNNNIFLLKVTGLASQTTNAEHPKKQKPRSAFIFAQSCQSLCCSVTELLDSVKGTGYPWFRFGLEFNGLVNTIKTMSSRSVYLTKLFLSRLSPLRR